MLEACYENERDLDLIQKFRASGDELLIDRLVKCRACGLQYISPRLRSDLILASYSEGEDPVYVSQMPARERTFAARSNASSGCPAAPAGSSTSEPPPAGFSPPRKRAAGLPRDASQTAGLRRGGRGSYGVRIRPGSVFEQAYEPGQFDVDHTLGRHRAHDESERHASSIAARCSSRAACSSSTTLTSAAGSRGGSGGVGCFSPRCTCTISIPHDHPSARIVGVRGRSHAAARPAAGTGLHPDAGIDLEWRTGQRGAGASPPLLGLGRMQVPYWLGQTFVAARRLHAVLLAAAAGLAELYEVLVLL